MERILVDWKRAGVLLFQDSNNVPVSVQYTNNLDISFLFHGDDQIVINPKEPDREICPSVFHSWHVSQFFKRYPYFSALILYGIFIAGCGE